MSADKDKSKVHKLNLKGSAKLVAEFVSGPENLNHSIFATDRGSFNFLLTLYCMFTVTV
jgi:hypothetical protein